MASTRAGGERSIAQVMPLLKLRHLGDRRFDYLVPADLTSRLVVGSVCLVSRSARGRFVP